MSRDLLKTTTAPEAMFQLSAFQAAAPIILALKECDDELREGAMNLFEQLACDDLDGYQRAATVALIAEILFPNADDKGQPGLDLAEAEEAEAAQSAEAKDVRERMDREESVFAERLQTHMQAKGLTQADLAAKVGIGQPAISMMLNRSCRPQKKTVRRFAESLGVAPEELWPGIQ